MKMNYLTALIMVCVSCGLGILAGEMMEYTKRPMLCGGIGLAAGLLVSYCIL